MSRYHITIMTCLTTLVGVASSAAPAPGSPEWITRFIEEAPALHTCHGRRPDGVIACANPACSWYNKANRLERSLIWSPEAPDQWRCEACGSIFPSETYPEDQIEEFRGLQFEYHLDPAGKKHYFTPVARWAKCYHALQIARSLGRAAARGDTDAAIRARDIVLAVAPVYENWIQKYYGGRIVYAGYPERCNWGRLGIFADYDWPAILCTLYGQLDQAGVMSDEQRGAFRGLVECMLENVTLPFTRQVRGLGNPMGQIWYDGVLSARTFPALRIHDLAFEAEFGRQRVLTAPDLIHDCLEGRFGVSNLLANYFYSDGLCRERTPAYHNMTITLLKRMLEALEGYADPPGYVPLEPDWQRLDDADLFGEDAVARVFEALPRVTYPDGHWVTVGDAQYLHGDFPPVTGSTYHPGWGLSILRRGTGASASAALLSTGSTLDGHTHVDHQTIAFFAQGHEQVTDIGYPVSGDRIQNTWWRGSAASHNTVVVDGRNQARSHQGYLTAFADTPAVTLAQQRDPGPYPQLADYRRTLLLVGGRDGAAEPGYVLDVFHVSGGRMHDYLLHAQEPSDEHPEARFSTANLSLNLLDEARSMLDMTPGAVSGEGYEHIAVTATGATSQPYEAAWETLADPRTVLRSLRLPESGEQVLVGRAPGYRHHKAGIHNSDRRLTKLICRRQGEDGLVSTFVSVMEAHRGAPAVGAARRLAVSGNGENHPVAVAIETAQGTDIAIVAQDPGLMSVPAWQIQTDARIAMISVDAAGQVLAMTMMEGTSLRMGERQITCDQAVISGTVLDHPGGLSTTIFQEQDAAILTDIPAARIRAGQRLYIDHAESGHSTYIVQGVEAMGAARTRVTLERPCRERIGRIAEVREEGRVLVPDTGLPIPVAGEGTCRRFAGMWVLVNERWHRLGTDIDEAYVLNPPVESGESLRGRPFVITRLGPGDTIRIPAIAYSGRTGEGL